MIEHIKRHDRLPKGEQPITEVGVDRLDEDGQHAGWLVLTPNGIHFLDEDHDSGHHDDHIEHTAFQGADLSGDDDLGTLTITWDDQGKVYEGATIELRAFAEAITDQLNP